MRILCSVLALAASVALVSNLSAADQPRRGPGGPGGRGQGQFSIVDMVVGRLELSDAQKAKVDELKKGDEAKLRAAREAFDKTLTEDQKTARDAARREAREARKSMEESREAVEKAMKLTDEQKKASKALDEMTKSVREKAMAILTPEQQETVKKRMADRGTRKPGAGR